MDRRAWQATVMDVADSDTTDLAYTHTLEVLCISKKKTQLEHVDSVYSQTAQGENCSMLGVHLEWQQLGCEGWLWNLKPL